MIGIVDKFVWYVLMILRIYRFVVAINFIRNVWLIGYKKWIDVQYVDKIYHKYIIYIVIIVYQAIEYKDSLSIWKLFVIIVWND